MAPEMRCTLDRAQTGKIRWVSGSLQALFILYILGAVTWSDSGCACERLPLHRHDLVGAVLVQGVAEEVHLDTQHP